MLFVDQATTQLWAAIIALGARVSTAAELAVVLATGKAAKPIDYDAIVGGMAQRYRGDQKALVAAALKKRYPNAGEMPINPVNWLAFFARTDAGVYVVDAERFLQTLDRVDVPDDDPRALGLDRALEDLSMATLMPEVERRILTGVKALVVHVCWRKSSNDDDGVPVAHMYWPHDVFVVCHPSAPNDDRSIVTCGLRQTPAGAPAGSDVWWVWSRTHVDNADGSVASWGPWKHVHIHVDGKHQSLPVEYPGQLLPILFARIEQADGGFWPAPEADVICQVDELNVSRSNEQHTVDLQGHGQGVYSGSFLESSEIPMGPDRWIKIGPQETITSVDFAPHLEDMRASRSQSIREVAVSRSANPDSYATTPTVAVSGVSRAIANLPHDKRVRELRPVFRRFEEQRLMPVVVEVINLYAPPSYSPTIGDDVVPRVVFGVPPDYEELDAKERRLAASLALGAIDLVGYSVLMGYDENERDARARLDTPVVDAAVSVVVDPAAAPVADVAKSALNGAQVTALLEVVAQVASGVLPKDAGSAVLVAAFPGIIDDKTASEILGKVVVVVVPAAPLFP